MAQTAGHGSIGAVAETAEASNTSFTSMDTMVIDVTQRLHEHIRQNSLSAMQNEIRFHVFVSEVCACCIDHTVSSPNNHFYQISKCDSLSFFSNSVRPTSCQRPSSRLWTSASRLAQRTSFAQTNSNTEVTAKPGNLRKSALAFSFFPTEATASSLRTPSDVTTPSTRLSCALKLLQLVSLSFLVQ